MRLFWMAATTTALLAIYAPSTAQAFECPKHFERAQEAIDVVKERLKGMEGRMQEEDMIRVWAHLDNAEMSLAEAKFHHERPGGRHHHARAILRAHEAFGHADAASALHWSVM